MGQVLRSKNRTATTWGRYFIPNIGQPSVLAQEVRPCTDMFQKLCCYFFCLQIFVCSLEHSLCMEWTSYCFMESVLLNVVCVHAVCVLWLLKTLSSLQLLWACSELSERSQTTGFVCGVSNWTHHPCRRCRPVSDIPGDFSQWHTCRLQLMTSLRCCTVSQWHPRLSGCLPQLGTQIMCWQFRVDFHLELIQYGDISLN